MATTTATCGKVNITRSLTGSHRYAESLVLFWRVYCENYHSYFGNIKYFLSSL